MEQTISCLRVPVHSDYFFSFLAFFFLAHSFSPISAASLNALISPPTSILAFS